MNEKDRVRARVRVYEDTDYDDVAQLWRTVKLTRQGGIVDSREEIREVKLRNPSTVLVAEVDGNVVGTIVGTFDGRRGFISRLGIDPAMQHHGIGSMLFGDLINRFKMLGVTRAAGFVSKTNISVLEFYKKFGAEVMDDVVPVRLNLDGKK